MPTSANVSVGKPAIAGAVFVAPVGTTLPTDAVTALDAAFAGLGYVSEDGLTNTMSIDSDNVKAWGGDTVLPIQTGFTDEFSLTLIESLNEDTLKTVFGASNVAGTIATGLSINVNSDEKESHAWVVDMILRGNHVKRIVVPSATITDIGEIVYKDDEAIGYELTLTAVSDASGNSHYEYIK